MSRRQRSERAAMGGDPYKTAIVKLMREFSHSHDPYSVFSDFVEMCALALSNRFDHPQFDAREKRYMDIVGKYKPDEVQRFAMMFAELQMCYRTRVDAMGDPGIGCVPDGGMGDVLGELFMALELGNSRAGQFFTPYSVSMLMAMLTIGDGASVRERGFVTLQEPACGSAGMVVATAQAMHQVGLNYPEALHATCVDIDQRLRAREKEWTSVERCKYWRRQSKMCPFDYQKKWTERALGCPSSAARIASPKSDISGPTAS